MKWEPGGISVSGEQRWNRALAALAVTAGADRSKLCVLSVGVVSVTGAGITLSAGEGAPRHTVCASDHVARAVEDIQLSTGEGPSFDALMQDRPVSEPYLAKVVSGRWPVFAPAALAAGALAVFGFPLRHGAARIGTLDLYRDRPGPLTARQLADALVIADVIAAEILTAGTRARAAADAAEMSGQPHLRLVGPVRGALDRAPPEREVADVHRVSRIGDALLARGALGGGVLSARQSAKDTELTPAPPE